MASSLSFLLACLLVVMVVMMPVSIHANNNNNNNNEQQPPAGTAPTTEPVDVAALIAQGDALIKAGKYDDALVQFTAAIKASPSANVYYKRAGIYLMRGKLKQGLEDLKVVLELNPSFSQARLRRGKVRASLGYFVDAEADLRQVLREKPDSDLAKKQLADLEKCSQDMEAAKAAFTTASSEEALRLINQVLEVATESREARLLRARINLKLKQYHSMLDDTMVVMKQDSRNLDALFLRGQAFYYIGEREAAMKHYREALKYDPDHSASKGEFKRLNKLEKAQNSAEENMKQSKFAEALQDYETALLLESSSPFVVPFMWLGKCRAHVQLRQAAPAIAACSEALKHDGGLVDAYLQRAEAHQLADDLDKALHDYHKVRESQPQNQQANEGIHRVQRLQKMAKRKDYYKILEITKQASDAEIRKAYRRLAKVYHPDKQVSEDKEAEAEAGKKYIEIAEAYEILSNEESRRKYDNGEDLDTPQHPGGGPFGHPFGGGGGGPFHFSFNFGG